MKRILFFFVIFLSFTAAQAQKTAVGESIAFYLSKGHGAYDSSILDSALFYLDKCEKLWRENFEVEKDTNFVNNVLAYLEDIQIQKGNLQKAIEYRKEIGIIYRNVFDEYDSHNSESLEMLINEYVNLGNYNEAIKHLKNYCQFLEKQFGKINETYVRAQAFLTELYYNSGNFLESIKINTELINIQKSISGEENLIYYQLLTNLSSDLNKFGDYPKAIETAKQAIHIIQKMNAETDNCFTISLNVLTNSCDKLAKYNESIKFIESICQTIENKYKKCNQPYVECLISLALLYYNSGNYTKAIELSSEIVACLKNLYGEENAEYAQALTNLASDVLEDGDYERALFYAQKAVAIKKQVLGETNNSYAESLVILANCYSKLGQDTTSIKLEKQVKHIFEINTGTNDENYAMILNNLALSYRKIGDTKIALKYNIEAEKILRNINANNIDYAKILLGLADAKKELGENEDALNLTVKAKNIIKDLLGEKHPYYIISLEKSAIINFILKNFKKSYEEINQSLKLRKFFILNSFLDLTNTERTTYWDHYKCEFLDTYPLIASVMRTVSPPTGLYNNTALFAKGLLLGAETEMTKLIQESGDAEALKKYENLRLDRMMLNKLYEKPIAERTINTDSLENLVNAQEKELVEKCKVYGDYTKNLRLTWKDVQQHLGEKDLAVEFLSFPVGKDSTMYVALTLCKNDTAPQMVSLFEQKQLQELPDTVTFNCPEMTALVWGKMQEQLKGIKSIYFAAAGQLHNIGIEYLPGMEDYNLYRLSSTRELVNHVKAEKPSKAVAYGNINYNGELVVHARNFNDSQEELLAYEPNTRGVRFLRGLRQSVGALPNSKKEIEDVTNALEKSNVKCVTLMNDSATEESFKALSGKHVNLLHIATHGFYYSEKEAEDVKGLRFLQMNNDIRGNNAEDKSLSRSALCFAGANTTLDNDTIPEGVDDGILTAQEIAQVDLRGLDLVVLSACQTACGDINQGEGVFGLQRGFKKAGAQSLLMSLWPVDDEATQILMSEFYKQYTSGKTKRAAFQAAQQHLRTVQKGRYNQPKYWAAFILLDAID